MFLTFCVSITAFFVLLPWFVAKALVFFGRAFKLSVNCVGFLQYRNLSLETPSIPNVPRITLRVGFFGFIWNGKNSATRRPLTLVIQGIQLRVILPATTTPVSDDLLDVLQRSSTTGSSSARASVVVPPRLGRVARGSSFIATFKHAQDTASSGVQLLLGRALFLVACRWLDIAIQNARCQLHEEVAGETCERLEISQSLISWQAMPGPQPGDILVQLKMDSFKLYCAEDGSNEPLAAGSVGQISIDLALPAAARVVQSFKNGVLFVESGGIAIELSVKQTVQLVNVMGRIERLQRLRKLTAKRVALSDVDSNSVSPAVSPLSLRKKSAFPRGSSSVGWNGGDSAAQPGFALPVESKLTIGALNVVLHDDLRQMELQLAKTMVTCRVFRGRGLTQGQAVRNMALTAETEVNVQCTDLHLSVSDENISSIPIDKIENNGLIPLFKITSLTVRSNTIHTKLGDSSVAVMREGAVSAQVNSLHLKYTPSALPWLYQLRTLQEHARAMNPPRVVPSSHRKLSSTSTAPSLPPLVPSLEILDVRAVVQDADHRAVAALSWTPIVIKAKQADNPFSSIEVKCGPLVVEQTDPMCVGSKLVYIKSIDVLYDKHTAVDLEVGEVHVAWDIQFHLRLMTLLQGLKAALPQSSVVRRPSAVPDVPSDDELSRHGLREDSLHAISETAEHESDEEGEFQDANDFKLPIRVWTSKINIGLWFTPRLGLNLFVTQISSKDASKLWSLGKTSLALRVPPSSFEDADPILLHADSVAAKSQTVRREFLSWTAIDLDLELKRLLITAELRDLTFRLPHDLDFGSSLIDIVLILKGAAKYITDLTPPPMPSTATTDTKRTGTGNLDFSSLDDEDEDHAEKKTSPIQLHLVARNTKLVFADEPVNKALRAHHHVSRVLAEEWKEEERVKDGGRWITSQIKQYSSEHLKEQDLFKVEIELLDTLLDIPVPDINRQSILNRLRSLDECKDIPLEHGFLDLILIRIKSAKASKVRLVLRDIALPFVGVEQLSASGDLVLAEFKAPPDGPYRLIKKVVLPNFRQYGVHKNFYSASQQLIVMLPRNAVPMKLFHDLQLHVVGLSLCHGLPMEGDLNDMSAATDRLTPKSFDPFSSPILPFWDKLRFQMHGLLKLSVQQLRVWLMATDDRHAHNYMLIAAQSATASLQAGSLDVKIQQLSVDRNPKVVDGESLLSVSEVSAAVDLTWKCLGDPYDHYCHIRPLPPDANNKDSNYDTYGRMRAHHLELGIKATLGTILVRETRETHEWLMSFIKLQDVVPLLLRVRPTTFVPKRKVSDLISRLDLGINASDLSILFWRHAKAKQQRHSYASVLSFRNEEETGEKLGIEVQLDSVSYSAQLKHEPLPDFDSPLAGRPKRDWSMQGGSADAHGIRGYMYADEGVPRKPTVPLSNESFPLGGVAYIAQASYRQDASLGDKTTYQKSYDDLLKKTTGALSQLVGHLVLLDDTRILWTPGIRRCLLAFLDNFQTADLEDVSPATTAEPQQSPLHSPLPTLQTDTSYMSTGSQPFTPTNSHPSASKVPVRYRQASKSLGRSAPDLLTLLLEKKEGATATSPAAGVDSIADADTDSQASMLSSQHRISGSESDLISPLSIASDNKFFAEELKSTAPKMNHEVLFAFVFERPQVNFQSSKTQSQLVLTASMATLECHKFWRSSDLIHIKKQLDVQLHTVESFVAPTDIDVLSGIQWVPRNNLSLPRPPSVHDLGCASPNVSQASSGIKSEPSMSPRDSPTGLPVPSPASTRSLPPTEDSSAMIKNLLSSNVSRVLDGSVQRRGGLLHRILTSGLFKLQYVFYDLPPAHPPPTVFSDCCREPPMEHIKLELPELNASLESLHWFTLFNVLDDVLFVRSTDAPVKLVKNEMRVGPMSAEQQRSTREQIRLELAKEERIKSPPIKKIEYLIGMGSIRMTRDHETFIGLDVSKVAGQHTFHADESGFTFFEIHKIDMKNLKDPMHKHMVGPLLASNQQWSEKECMFTIRAQDRFFKTSDGYKWQVLDQLEVMACPLRIQITSQIYNEFYKYIFNPQLNDVGDAAKLLLPVPKAHRRTASANVRGYTSGTVTPTDTPAMTHANSFSSVSSVYASSPAGSSFVGSLPSFTPSPHYQANPYSQFSSVPGHRTTPASPSVDNKTPSSVDDMIVPDDKSKRLEFFAGASAAAFVDDSELTLTEYKRNVKKEPEQEVLKAANDTQYTFFRYVRVGEVKISVTYKGFVDLQDVKLTLTPHVKHFKLLSSKQFYDKYAKHVLSEVLSQGGSLLKQKFQGRGRTNTGFLTDETSTMLQTQLSNIAKENKDKRRHKNESYSQFGVPNEDVQGDETKAVEAFKSRLLFGTAKSNSNPAAE